VEKRLEKKPWRYLSLMQEKSRRWVTGVREERDAGIGPERGEIAVNGVKSLHGLYTHGPRGATPG